MAISFAPLIPLFLLVICAIFVAIICTIAFLSKQRGAILRTTAFALVLLALANPIFTDEEREPVQNIVSVIIDKSQSQSAENRKEQTDQTLALLEEQLAKYKNIDVRVREVEHDKSDNPATNLFSALSNEISDIPANRLAGSILITDGQVHDIPENLEQMGINSPIHSLITGDEEKLDIRVEITKAPRFGLVGEYQELIYQVFIDGNREGYAGSEIEVELKLNGEFISTEIAPIGSETSAFVEIPRRGENLIELSVTPIEDEVSEINNKAVIQTEGIRQNLRVLLISGAPHSGERAWRDLLKSDTSIDLVHFTILRPPDRSDGTPIDELSLIAFPTRELFLEKIDEFDLIILDRYQRLGVLSILYYDNIARYVEDGGALLIAAGPEFSGIQSIATTPLATVLPALPTGRTNKIGYYPRISTEGEKHPVSRDLPGSATEPPNWGRWFRSIEVDGIEGDNILNGPNQSPLLVLNRVDQGRVAMLLSDHSWLWSRGFEGGGPHISLYRRIAHWLMGEPALEEEAIFASSNGENIQITRQTMADNIQPLELISPSGERGEIILEQTSPGRFELELDTQEAGLYQIIDGDLSTLVHVGAVDAPEFKQVISTVEKLQPIATQSKGIVKRVANDGAIELPQIVPVRQLPNSLSSANSNRMLLRTSNETVLVGVTQYPLLGGLLGLAVLLMIMSLTWYREGR
ncbi:MAG: hypothetical protein ABJE63_16370 [Lentilitoribacter sp.]